MDSMPASFWAEQTTMCARGGSPSRPQALRAWHTDPGRGARRAGGVCCPGTEWPGVLWAGQRRQAAGSAFGARASWSCTPSSSSSPRLPLGAEDPSPPTQIWGRQGLWLHLGFHFTGRGCDLHHHKAALCCCPRPGRGWSGTERPALWASREFSVCSRAGGLFSRSCHCPTAARRGFPTRGIAPEDHCLWTRRVWFLQALKQTRGHPHLPCRSHLPPPPHAPWAPEGRDRTGPEGWVRRHDSGSGSESGGWLGRTSVTMETQCPWTDSRPHRTSYALLGKTDDTCFPLGWVQGSAFQLASPGTLPRGCPDFGLHPSYHLGPLPVVFTREPGTAVGICDPLRGGREIQFL